MGGLFPSSCFSMESTNQCHSAPIDKVLEKSDFYHWPQKGPISAFFLTSVQEPPVYSVYLLRSLAKGVPVLRDRAEQQEAN